MSIDSFLSAGDIEGLATFCEESELNVSMNGQQIDLLFYAISSF